jgi:hypothetical protein
MPSVNLNHPRGGAQGAPQRPFKQRRPVGDPIAFSKTSPRFIPPPLTNRTNLTMALQDVLKVDPIVKAGKIVFHSVGDTGGIYGTEVQDAIAEAMEAQYHAADAADQPAFLYHLGDVIYDNGQLDHYTTQFYEPYQYYPPFIFAIPGNHDGDTRVHPGDAPDPEATLTGFMDNFCDSQPHPASPYRHTVTQPYVYWTLDTPLVTIIGLYSNVDGSLDGRGTSEQQTWLQNELANAPTDRCLIVAMHHPPYSLDAIHGGSPDIVHALENAAQAAKRYPDAVFSGHIHSYQRFTRTLNTRQIPYVIAGAGGYANSAARMHRLQKSGASEIAAPFTTTEPGVVLSAQNTTSPGFLRITVDATTLTGEYFLVPFQGTPPTKAADTFSLNWKKHKVTTLKP